MMSDKELDEMVEQLHKIIDELEELHHVQHVHHKVSQKLLDRLNKLEGDDFDE